MPDFSTEFFHDAESAIDLNNCAIKQFASPQPESTADDKWQQAWSFYFEQYPHVLASWRHQNGRWPHYEDIPDWYEANPECKVNEGNN